MAEPAMRDRLLDAAEARARQGGYHGFSFRDLAEDVGVKSASVHYHFPTKADLAEHLARRYTENAQVFLSQPAPRDAAEAVERARLLFRNALALEDKMCLCGVFAAERDVLPVPVAHQVGAFFDMILQFLEQYLKDKTGANSPVAVLARLEGALLLGRAKHSVALFDAATEAL